MHSYSQPCPSPGHAGHLCVILKMCVGVTGDEAIASYTCVYTHTTDTSSYKFRQNFLQNPSPIIVTKSKEKEER